MSYVPGSSVVVRVTSPNGIGLVGSDTLNPLSPLEYGRQVDAASRIKTDDADGKLPYAP
jgi:hypothetical protein